MLQARYNHDEPLQGWDEDNQSILTASTEVTTQKEALKAEEGTKGGAGKGTKKEKKTGDQKAAPGKGGNPMYMTKQKKQKKEKPKMTSSLPASGKPKVNHFVQNPNANVQPSFYDRFIRNKDVLTKQFQAGQLVSGRIYMSHDTEPNGSKTCTGYVHVEGLPQPVKVWGLKNLNRAYEMDEVWLRFVQWTDWGKASDKKVADIKFDKHLEFIGGGAQAKAQDDDQDSNEDGNEEEEEHEGEEGQDKAEGQEGKEDEQHDEAQAEEQHDEQADQEEHEEEAKEEQKEDETKQEADEYAEEYGNEEGEDDDYYGEDYYGEDYDQEEEGEEGEEDAAAETGAEEGEEKKEGEEEAEEYDEEEEGYYDEEEGGGDEDYDEEEDEEGENQEQEECEDPKEEKKLEKPKEEQPTSEAVAAQADLVEPPKLDKKQSSKKQPNFVPQLSKAPQITSREELLSFMNGEPVKYLRPLAKVVAITDSILKKQHFYGMMSRRRIGKKEDNKWRQFIEPEDKENLKNVKSFMIDDPKIKDTQPRRVKFHIIGWKEKQPIAKLVKEE